MDNEEVMAGQNAQPINEGTQPAEQVAVSPEPTAEATTAAEENKSEARPSTVQELEAGMQLTGRVKNIVDFGAFIDLGVGRDGLAHVSTLKRAGIDKTLKVGDEIQVQIRRIDMEKNRISLTIPGPAGSDSRASIADLQVGAQLKGRVVRLVDFGAFVDLGAQTDGLVHVSQMQGGFVNHPSEVVKVGDEIDVRVLEVDPERRRISLTMKTEEESAAAPAARLSEPRRQFNQPARDDRSQGGQERRPRRPRKRAPVSATFTSETGDNSVPTAFEFAWQQALSSRKEQQD